ncbi:MAG TPA: hypothetical protein PLX89_15105 [Verrucomicrobiota bacterium]|nr:hypothetical protein [Verrucomicrobiota bacterium]
MTFPTLTDRDRRTLRLAALGLGLYLALFFGWKALSFLGQRHAEYARLRREAASLRLKFELYDARVARLKKLMESFQMDPAQLSKTTLVADASAALQQAAMQGRLQLGPIRETLTRGSERELGTIRLEAAGQVPDLMAFLYRIRSLGFPLIIDSLQFGPEPRRPGTIKVTLGLILLNYDRWDEKEVPNA